MLNTLNSIDFKKKIINKMTIALIVASFIFNIGTTVVHAASAAQIAQKGTSALFNLFQGDVMGAIDALTEEDSYNENSFEALMAKDILGGVSATINEVLSPDNPVYDLAIGSYNADGTWASGGIVKNNVFTSLKVIAGLWCMAIALSRLIQNIDRGIDPMEAVFKTLIEITIVCIFIMYLERIVGIICGLGLQFIEIISSGVGGGEADPGAAADAAANARDFLIKVTGKDCGTMAWRLETNVKLFVPWVATKAAGIAATMACYQILIEIGIRRMFVPLAIGDIYQEGLRSPGVRYLKKLLAAFLKIAICCVLGEFMSATAQAVLGGGKDGISYAFAMLAVDWTICSVMFKTGEYANDIMGVF